MSGVPPHIGRTRVSRGLIAGCGAAIVLSAAWAAWPLAITPAPSTTVPVAGTSANRPVTALAALSLDAFRVPIWVAPPPPPAPEKAAPPPPLKLQLLAIIREGGACKAALYDPDADKVLVVAAGEELGPGRVVEAVTEGGVSLRDGRGVRTLALREEGRP